MAAAWIWGLAAALYAAFRLWYDGRRRPLRADEVEAAVARLREAPDTTPERLERMRRFLEADDGGEFVMLNLVRLHPEPVARPGGGASEPAERVLEAYTRPFLRALLRRAGHPLFVGPAAGGYLEAWGVEPDPGWSFAGLIRYRSRRDLVALATHPAFEPAHVFKRAAVANTLAFPVRPRLRVGLSPRGAAALVLALAAALAHLALA
jgi:hypothetical protein